MYISASDLGGGRTTSVTITYNMAEIYRFSGDLRKKISNKLNSPGHLQAFICLVSVYT